MDILRLWEEENKKTGAPRPLPAGRSCDDLCPSCLRNGRVYCPHRPILALKAELASSLDRQDFFGPSPPNLFVGHFGWPQINWGPLVSLCDGVPDNPKDWYGWNFDQIVRARSLQVRGMSKNSVGAASLPKSAGLGRLPSMPRMLADSQEAAMSVSPIDLELWFSKKPQMRVELHAIHQPMGPSAPLEKLALADNARIPSKLDELVEEKVGAHQAVVELLHCGFDEHYLTRLLTAGILGKPERKKLVPTRWGITAIDDLAAKEHMKKIRGMRPNGEFMLFSNEYLANRFHILLLPGAWEYEGFEAWCGPMVCPNATKVQALAPEKNKEQNTSPATEASSAPASVSQIPDPSQFSPSPRGEGRALAPSFAPSVSYPSFAISRESEPFWGRTNYASRQGGGYYAARLGVTEALATRLKIQARALVIREILPEYDLPVGVWEIRENVRHAMQKKPEKFNSLKELLASLSSRLALPAAEYLLRSNLLKQRRLLDF